MAGDGRAQMLMLALCSLENSPVFGANGHLAARFGRKGPGALNFRHKNVGWTTFLKKSR
jgi:hypothetical protein